jgi:hypothetical protein
MYSGIWSTGGFGSPQGHQAQRVFPTRFVERISVFEQRLRNTPERLFPKRQFQETREALWKGDDETRKVAENGTTLKSFSNAPACELSRLQSPSQTSPISVPSTPYPACVNNVAAPLAPYRVLGPWFPNVADPFPDLAELPLTTCTTRTRGDKKTC